MEQLRELASFGRAVWDEWNHRRATRLAASLAFFSVFSLAPLTVVAVFLVGQAFGEELATGRLMRLAEDVVGEQGARAVAWALSGEHLGEGGAPSTLFSVALLIFGASYVFAELKDALNSIWDVRERSDVGLKKKVLDRLVGVAMVLTASVTLAAIIIFDQVLLTLSQQLAGVLPVNALVYRVLNHLLLLTLAVVGVAAIYKFVPDVRLSWRSVWPGAVLSGVLFLAAKVAFATYLQYSDLGSLYGAASSLAVVLVWIFVGTLVLFLGAEVTQVYARRRGDGFEPEGDVVRIETVYGDEAEAHARGDRAR